MVTEMKYIKKINEPILPNIANTWFEWIGFLNTGIYLNNLKTLPNSIIKLSEAAGSYHQWKSMHICRYFYLIKQFLHWHDIVPSKRTCHYCIVQGGVWCQNVRYEYLQTKLHAKHHSKYSFQHKYEFRYIHCGVASLVYVEIVREPVVQEANDAANIPPLTTDTSFAWNTCTCVICFRCPITL